MHQRRTGLRRRPIGLAWALAIVASCGGGDDLEGYDASDWSPEVVQADPDMAVQPSIAVGPLAVGANRVAFGLVGQDRQLVSDADVTARFFTLTERDGGFVGELVTEAPLTPVHLPQDYEHEHADGTDHGHTGRDATVYVTELELTRPEWWGAELSIELDGEPLPPMKVPFWVESRSAEPAIGDPVPSSVQATTADVADIALIDSAEPPQPQLHDITVADALQQRRPLVVAFATAAFCQTQFCGPVIDGVVIPLSERFADDVEFIVIEPFDLEAARGGQLLPVAVMSEWGLDTEPWVFVTDAEGRVVAKFQGITSEAEVGSAIERALTG